MFIMEIKKKTNNTQRRKSASFGFFANKSRNFKTGSGPRCSAAKKSKQRKIPAENNKTFAKLKMSAKKVPITVPEDEDSDVEILFGNRKLFEMSATESAESTDHEAETDPRPAPPTPPRPTTSRLRARDLTLDLNLVQPSPGPRPNRFRFGQRPETLPRPNFPTRPIDHEIVEAEAAPIGIIETEDAHYIITDPDPDPYVTYYTEGPSYESFIVGSKDEADAESTVNLCSDPDCSQHGDNAETESIITGSSYCDNPHCQEHGACPESEAEEDVCELLSQGAVRTQTGWQCQDCNQNNNKMSEADLKEIERKIEEAAEPEEEEDAEDVAHAALMNTLDQVIDRLANSEASEEMISLGQELCKVVDSIATPTVGGVKMIINPGAGAGAATEPRPSTSRAASNTEEIRPLRVRAHRVGVWVRQATKKAEYKKGEEEANLKEVE